MELFDYLALASIVFLFLLGSPLAVTFSIGSIAIMIHTMGFPLGNVSQVFFTTISSYPMLAMPFFILAGNIMNQGGIAKRLVRLARLAVGKMPGYLAATNVRAT